MIGFNQAARQHTGRPYPTSNEIVSFDRVITSLTDDALTRFRRAAIGVIFQAFNLLPTLLNAARAKAKNLPALVGLSDRLVHRPDKLSDEQQQRVAMPVR